MMSNTVLKIHKSEVKMRIHLASDVEADIQVEIIHQSDCARLKKRLMIVWNHHRHTVPKV